MLQILKMDMFGLGAGVNVTVNMGQQNMGHPNMHAHYQQGQIPPPGMNPHHQQQMGPSANSCYGQYQNHLQGVFSNQATAWQVRILT